MAGHGCRFAAGTFVSVSEAHVAILPGLQNLPSLDLILEVLLRPVLNSNPREWGDSGLALTLLI